MDEDQLWKDAWDNLDRLRATLQKEMNDWAEIQQRIDDLHMRAHKDPKAAEALASLEAYLQQCRANGDDVQGRMEQLQSLIKEMNLRAAQDRREIQRYKEKAFASRGSEEQLVPAPPRAEDAAGTPKKKRVRRFA